LLAVIHATPQIAWQREFAPKMLAGLLRMGVSAEVVHDTNRREGLPILLGTTRWRSLEQGDYLLVDRCSFGDTNRWVTLVRNGHGRRGDHRVPNGAPAERWERYAVPVMPWQSGKRVILCGQHESWSPHWPNVRDWYQTVPATHFRKHPAADNPTGLPETRSWKEAGLAVTLNSSVAVDAVLAGVPTVTMDEAAMAWDVTGHSPDERVKPERRRWLHWLAWTQWTHDEIAEGKWAHLL
jgi:hypothetical protein